MTAPGAVPDEDPDQLGQPAPPAGESQTGRRLATDTRMMRLLEGKMNEPELVSHLSVDDENTYKTIPTTIGTAKQWQQPWKTGDIERVVGPKEPRSHREYAEDEEYNEKVLAEMISKVESKLASAERLEELKVRRGEVRVKIKEAVGEARRLSLGLPFGASEEQCDEKEERDKTDKEAFNKKDKEADNNAVYAEELFTARGKHVDVTNSEEAAAAVKTYKELLVKAAALQVAIQMIRMLCQ